MEELMKTEWLAIINRKRNGTYPEWTSEPVVLIEDTDEKVFDIVDTKDLGDPIVRPENTGTATYYNGDEVNRYHIRFIKNEEFFNQFRIVDENGKIKTIRKEDQEFSYRKSIFQRKNWIILGGKIQLEKGKKEEIKNKIEEYSRSRREKQPLNMPNAGSIFKRGEGFVTAKLIDECGLKGYRIGDAEVSTLHAGFIVNKGKATAEDVLKLMQYIKEKVQEKFNVNIEPEIRILGED